VRRSVPAKALAKLWFRASGPREVAHQRMNVPPMLPLDAMKAPKPRHRRCRIIHRAVQAESAAVAGIEHAARREDGLRFAAGESDACPMAGRNKIYHAVAGGAGPLGGRAWNDQLRQPRRLAESANCQFVDVATKISLAPNDFFKLVHNTPSGARKIGGFFARQVPIAKREAIAAPTH
jgi:hypothetical protein